MQTQRQAVHHHPDTEFTASLLAARISLMLELKTVAERIQRSQAVGVEQRESFCESLVDYIAMGHFGLYEHILNSPAQSDPQLRELARLFYPLMLRGDHLALLFNDHHSMDNPDTGSETRFVLEFSEVGLMLAQRFKAEDQLLHLAGL